MFCINLFRLGLNPKAIQKIMGYANTSTTLDTYTHMEDKALREQVGELGNNISFAAVSFGADGVQSSNDKEDSQSEVSTISYTICEHDGG